MSKLDDLAEKIVDVLLEAKIDYNEVDKVLLYVQQKLLYTIPTKQ